jgi:hypothetical protein
MHGIGTGKMVSWAAGLALPTAVIITATVHLFLWVRRSIHRWRTRRAASPAVTRAVTLLPLTMRVAAHPGWSAWVQQRMRL